MLGRICRASPQFINSSDGSWFGTSACIERITQMSSMCSAVCLKSSLTSRPHLPRFSNLKNVGSAAPVFRSVARFGLGSALPAYLASAGLWSQVSTWLGPPLAKMWMTRFALTGNWGFFGARGFSDVSTPRAS